MIPQSPAWASVSPVFYHQPDLVIPQPPTVQHLPPLKLTTKAVELATPPTFMLPDESSAGSPPLVVPRFDEVQPQLPVEVAKPDLDISRPDIHHPKPAYFTASESLQVEVNPVLVPLPPSLKHRGDVSLH